MRTTIAVRGRQIPRRYRLAEPYVRPGPGAATQPLSLLVVKASDQASGRQHQRRAPSFFLVNAVPERVRRGGGAVLKAAATGRAVPVQVCTYALLVLVGYRAWGDDRHPARLRPAGLWWHGVARWGCAPARAAPDHRAPGPKRTLGSPLDGVLTA